MNDLMTLDEIAKMWRCSREKARAVVKIPGFPEEAPSSSRQNRLWIRAEVRPFKANWPILREELKRAEHAAFSAKCQQIDDRSAANRRHHGAKRRSALMLRTPPWADLKAIEAVYREAIRLENSTGVDHHVDHVIPLQGRKVSGLHVATNLRAIPKLDNLKKCNQFEVTA